MNFITPKDHEKFLAKLLDKNIDGNIKDIAIAYIEPNGGGPKPAHTHNHNHYFIVTKGEIVVEYENKKRRIKKDESILVIGTELHSVMNYGDEEAVVVGISVDI